MRDYNQVADQAFNLFKEGYALIPEGNLESNNPIDKANAITRNWGTKVISGFETAKKQVGKDDEREVRLADGIVKEVSQLVFVLFRRGLLTEDLEKKFRKLPLFEETDAAVVYYVEKRDKEVQRILAERNKVQKEQRALDIFQAVLTQGMTEEEAEAQMKKHEEQMGGVNG